jgi:hypothetical protein
MKEIILINNLRSVIILFTILLIACSNQKTKQEKVVIPQREEIENLAIQQSENIDSTADEHIDTTNIYENLDTPEYPKEGVSEIILLKSGTFHNDEVRENANKLNWTGLFFKNGEYYTEETSLHLKKVKDQIVDEENEMSGWEVATGVKDSCLILISGFKFPDNGKVPSIKFPNTPIFPGDSLKVDFNGTSYTLYVTGNKKKASDDWYNVSNYKLYLKERSEGRERSQLIRATSTFDDAYTSILWMGDIDGDKKLDLVIDISRHYNNSIIALYLSSKANAGELVKYIGAHSITGC